MYALQWDNGHIEIHETFGSAISGVQYRDDGRVDVDQLLYDGDGIGIVERCDVRVYTADELPSEGEHVCIWKMRDEDGNAIDSVVYCVTNPHDDDPRYFANLLSAQMYMHRAASIHGDVFLEAGTVRESAHSGLIVSQYWHAYKEQVLDDGNLRHVVVDGFLLHYIYAVTLC